MRFGFLHRQGGFVNVFYRRWAFHALSSPDKGPAIASMGVMQTPEAFSLTGRTALITGAGSPTGIGFASARTLGQLGARVAITGTTDRIHERVSELTALGIDATGFIARLENAALAATFGADLDFAGLRPDILVNNAGMIATTDAQIISGDALMPTEDWDASLALNLTSAFLVTRLVLPRMREQNWGRIINVSSLTGPVMAARGDLAYAAAKAGIVGLTKALAVDEARAGITANAVAPGWISTGSQLDYEALEGHLVPAGRSGTAEEVASAIVWLATPGAAYITGQVIVVDGGNSVAEQRLPH